MIKQVSFHVDIDSPRRLLEFWDINSRFDEQLLDRFYEVSMERVLNLFNDCGVKATFFVVGDELKISSKAREYIKNAYLNGHEIANHTYSHPFGFSNLTKEEVTNEIVECSNVIRELLGISPRGFRSPGYDMNVLILDTLEELSFSYDSSAFYTILKTFIKFYHNVFSKKFVYTGFGGSLRNLPDHPYYPSLHDWQKKASVRKIIEIPLARTKHNLPFYNNFHLLSGNLYRKMAISSMKKDYFVYLFHLIEFTELSDACIPSELKIHPNLKLKIKTKLEIMKDTISRITNNYKIVRTDEFVNQINNFNEKNTL